MKLIITLGFDGGRDEFIGATMDRLRQLVADQAVQRAALDVKVTGEELDIVKRLDNDSPTTAMVALWEPTAGTDIVEGLGKAISEGNTRVTGAYRVDEVIQKDYTRTWGAEVSPGVKCVPFVRRKAGITHEEYSEHWRLRHGPLAVSIQPGFWHYVQNHVVECLSGDATIDGIGELHFLTAVGINTEMFINAEAERMIREDVQRFMDPKRSFTVPTKEYLIP